jgi:hypothetical protein
MNQTGVYLWNRGVEIKPSVFNHFWQLLNRYYHDYALAKLQNPQLEEKYFPWMAIFNAYKNKKNQIPGGVLRTLVKQNILSQDGKKCTALVASILHATENKISQDNPLNGLLVRHPVQYFMKFCEKGRTYEKTEMEPSYNTLEKEIARVVKKANRLRVKRGGKFIDQHPRKRIKPVLLADMEGAKVEIAAYLQYAFDRGREVLEAYHETIAPLKPMIGGEDGGVPYFPGRDRIHFNDAMAFDFVAGEIRMNTPVGTFVIGTSRERPDKPHEVSEEEICAFVKRFPYNVVRNEGSKRFGISDFSDDQEKPALIHVLRPNSHVLYQEGKKVRVFETPTMTHHGESEEMKAFFATIYHHQLLPQLGYVKGRSLPQRGGTAYELPQSKWKFQEKRKARVID